MKGEMLGSSLANAMPVCELKNNLRESIFHCKKNVIMRRIIISVGFLIVALTT